jgi:hypothetical protein
MNTICRWVHGKDGALVMEWTKADDPEVRWDDAELRGADGFEAAYALMELNHDSDALTPVGL